MMILAVLLMSYAAVMGSVGHRPLARLVEQTRQPLLGAWVWLLACGSVLAAWSGAALLAAGWHLPAFAAAVIERCLTTAEPPHDHVHVTAPAVALPVLVASTLRAAWVTVRGYSADIRFRRRHVHAARLVGSADGNLGGVIVVDASEPAVYSVTGPRPTIVVTTGARSMLSPTALAAALDHERCHLAERHFVLLGAGRLMARAFPFVPLFRAAEARIADLIEMRADDVAARRHGARSVIDALTAIASAPHDPNPAADARALARASRLVADAKPRGQWRLPSVAVAFALGPAIVLLLPFCG
jgi:Zn-dependent protease with chaperone function